MVLSLYPVAALTQVVQLDFWDHSLVIIQTTLINTTLFQMCTFQTHYLPNSNNKL